MQFLPLSGNKCIHPPELPPSLPSSVFAARSRP
jgi:hypothetical protein